MIKMNEEPASKNGCSFFTKDNEFKNSNSKKYRLVGVGVLLIASISVIASYMMIQDVIEIVDSGNLSTEQTEEMIQDKMLKVLNSAPVYADYNADDSYTINIQKHFELQGPINIQVNAGNSIISDVAVALKTGFEKEVRGSNYYSFYEIKNIRHGEEKRWMVRYLDIWILSFDKPEEETSKNLLALSRDDNDAQWYKCCLNQPKVYESINGVIRAITYIKREFEQQPDYIFTMYEGNSFEADPYGFGRSISGFGNFSFIGYFQDCGSHGFWCTHSMSGTGVLYKSKVSKTGIHTLVARYHGIYDEGQNWETQIPKWRDKDEESYFHDRGNKFVKY